MVSWPVTSAAEFDPTGKRCLSWGRGRSPSRGVRPGPGRGRDVAVVNRTAPKAEDVAALAGSVGRAVPSADAAQIAQADLVVNATQSGWPVSGGNSICRR